MKHLRLYEDLGKLENGEYVICSSESIVEPTYKEFVSNSIGQVVDFGSGNYKIEFMDLPETLWASAKQYWYRWFDLVEILFHSKDKKECEIFLNVEKYNI